MSVPCPGAEPEVVVAQSALDMPDAKASLRATVRTQRARRSASERALLDAARTQAVLTALDQQPEPPACVACYVSVGDEPDTTALLAALLGRGARVLVPLLRGRHQPAFGVLASMDALRPGLWGIPEPVDAVVAPLADADLVLCSALAATPDGRRLGVGGGWYDRTLPSRRPGAPVWALLHDDEVLRDVPASELDQRVDALVTETGVRRTGD